MRLITRGPRYGGPLRALLAQQMAKTPIAALLPIDWATVGRIVQRVVQDKLEEGRLKDLGLIGVDEVSWDWAPPLPDLRRRHRWGDIVWDQGRQPGHLGGHLSKSPARGFRASIGAVSIDMSGGYESAVRAAAPRSRSASTPGRW